MKSKIMPTSYEDPVVTVGKLKKFIKDLPDDTPVFMEIFSDYGCDTLDYPEIRTDEHLIVTDDLEDTFSVSKTNCPSFVETEENKGLALVISF